MGTGSSSSNIESYHYNGRNQLDQITYGNGQTVNYTYDNQERLASASDANGKILDYDYNSNGLLGSATYYSEGTPVTTDYQYDFAERYTSCYNSKGFGIDTITYDKNNNNTGYRTYLKHGNVDLAWQTKYSYNSVNALTQMSTESVSVLMDNTYDNFGRLSSSTIKNSTAEAVKMTYSFLDASSVRTTNLLSGYNVYVGGSGTPKYSYQYTYDPSGNVTKVVDSSTNRTINYEYDKLNQLTSVSNYGNLGLKDVYQYDSCGNITRKDTYAVSDNTSQGYAVYRYSTTAPDQLEVFSICGADGTVKRERLYQYDGVGNPGRIVDSSCGQIGLSWTQGKKLKEYYYNDVHNTYYYNESDLVSKVVKADGSSIEYFYDDGQLEFEEYRKASGAVERVHKYYYDDDGIVRFLQVIGSDWLSSSGRYNVYAYVYDGNGNITDLVRVRQLRNLWTYSDATPVAHYEYDAYGNILSETCSDNAAKYNPIKYKGYYYESDTKMYRLDSRYYDPLIGRFLNADDPSLLIESPSALTDKNLYSYCDNNPVMRKDSDGEFWHIAVGAAIGAATGALIEIGKQLYCNGKVTDWGSVAQNAVSGAVTGGFAASGAGLALQVLVNAGSGLATAALSVDKTKSKTDQIIEIAAGGAVGAIAGRVGGPGVGKQVGRIASSPIKRTVNTLKSGKGLKTAAKEFRKGWRYVKKHSKYLYTRGLRKDCYWRGYLKSGAAGKISDYYLSKFRRR